MISNLRHTEKLNGKFLYIAETRMKEYTPEHPYGHIYPNSPINKEFTKKFMGVPFYEGVGKFTNRKKAQYFSEQLGYNLILHKDDKPWVEAVTGKPTYVETFDAEDVMSVDDEISDGPVDDEDE